MGWDVRATCWKAWGRVCMSYKHAGMAYEWDWESYQHAGRPYKWVGDHNQMLESHMDGLVATLTWCDAIRVE